ncbi:MAG: DUF4255 domain-containing protein [Pseudonocardiaceae bacterium]
MSNSLSVAMVTAALGRILGEALVGVPAGGVENAQVTTLRPDTLANVNGDARGINIFLYQVTANGAWTSADLPTRRADGTVMTRPQQALDLHYLLTFSGDESTLEPQRMLGIAVSTLVARPVLSRELLRDIIEHARNEDPTAWEQFSDLADQIDVVRFTLQPLNLDELSTLWSTFLEAPYRLSVTYQAAVVLLDNDVTPQPALPVLTRGIDAAAVQVPSISRVVSDSAPTDPVVPGTTLRIEGQRLRGTFLTRVRLDDIDVLVPADQVTGTRLTVDLPQGVTAGVRTVQVVHPRLVGSPPQERAGAESDATPLIVRPVVRAAITATLSAVPGVVDITVPLAPPVGKRQRVVLTLNEHHPPTDRVARAYTFVAPRFDPQGPETTDQVTVPVRGVTAGRYLVRVQVDGAESVLGVGGDGRFDTPQVTIP